MKLTSHRQIGHSTDSGVSCSPAVKPLLFILLAILTGCQSTPERPSRHAADIRSVPADTQASSTDADRRGDQVNPHYSLNDFPNPAQQTPHTTSGNQSTWLATIQTDFKLARKLVEEDLQVDLRDIRLQLVDDEPINTEVAFETRRLIKKQFGSSVFARQFLEQVMHPLAGTYAALYSSRLRSVMISAPMLANYERGLDPARHRDTRAALLTLLIHELVHAADDQRYNIHDNRALTFRASFAQSASFEGHAQWVTRRICKAAGCSTGLQALDDFMFSTDEQNNQLTQPVEAISRNVLEYSYVEGERFITGLAERKNGQQLIDSLLNSPPVDPIQILSPETYPDVARELRNQQLVLASRTVDHPWGTAPWISVETSPLKGVDLRADPVRRQAAIDGFTRLIQAMVSMQFYDQLSPEGLPMEATLLTAESSHTARLFATMLHTNTQHSGAHISDEPLSIGLTKAGVGAQPMQMHIYRTAIDADDKTRFTTVVAVAGKHVVQVSGSTPEQELLDDYAILVLLKLQGGQ